MSPPSVVKRPRRTVSPLKLKRVAEGLSQLELAELAGISREQISKIEGGKVDPRVSTLTTLAIALRCAPAEFVAPTNSEAPVTTPRLREGSGRQARHDEA